MAAKRILLTVAFLFCSFASFGQEDPAPVRKGLGGKRDLDSIFRALGAEDYAKREAAGLELVRLGASVREALETLALKTKDPEIRARSCYVLQIIHKKRLETEGHGFLGVNIKEEQHPVTGDTAVQVSGLVKDFPAEKAGIKDKDFILEVDGVPAKSVAQIQKLVGNHPAGEEVSFKILRGKVTKIYLVRLAARRDAPDTMTFDKNGKVKARELARPGQAKLSSILDKQIKQLDKQIEASRTKAAALPKGRKREKIEQHIALLGKKRTSLVGIRDTLKKQGQ